MAKNLEQGGSTPPSTPASDTAPCGVIVRTVGGYNSTIREQVSCNQCPSGRAVGPFTVAEGLGDGLATKWNAICGRPRQPETPAAPKPSAPKRGRGRPKG